MPDIKDIKTKPVSDEFKKKIRDWRPPDDDEPLIPVSFGNGRDELSEGETKLALKTKKIIGQSHEVPEIFFPSQEPSEDANKILKSSNTIEDAFNREDPNHVTSTNPASKIDTNVLQTYRKHTANILQTSGKHNAIMSQTYGKPTANLQREGDDRPLKHTANVSQTSGEPTAKPTAKPNANHNAEHTAKRGRVRNLVQPKLYPTSDIRGLSLLQKKVTFFLYDSCKEIRERHTNTVYSKSAASAIGASVAAFRGAIDDLIIKQITDRRDWKDGPGGWTDYWLADSTYQEILELEQSGEVGQNLLQTYGKHTANHAAKHNAKPTATPASSSSLDPSSFSSSIPDQLTTTTEIEPEPKPERQEVGLPEEWKEIDFTGLVSIHFGRHHLKQIFSAGKGSAEMVQESIFHLAHDLEVGGHGLKSPLLVLLKQLRSKGEPYTSIKGYVSDEQRYQQMRLAELKRQKEEADRIKFEIAELESELAASADDQAFQEWAKGLTEAKRREYAPAAAIDKSSMQLSLLKEYFRENIPTHKRKPVDQIRRELTQCIEEIRNAEDGYASTVDAAVRDAYLTSLVRQKDRRDQIFTSYPELKKEFEEIETVIDSALKGLDQ